MPSDVSLYSNQLLIKCQILAVLDVLHTNVHGMQSTDDVRRVLSPLKASKYSTLCHTKNKNNIKKKEIKRLRTLFTA